MPAYATPEQYEASPWSRDGATATERELLQASLLVDAALQGAVYRTGNDGLPVDAGVAGALRDAVVAIVDASQPDPATDSPDPDNPVAGIPGLKAATIAGVRYELATAVEAVAAGTGTPVLPFPARQLLRNAGLGGGVVYVSG